MKARIVKETGLFYIEVEVFERFRGKRTQTPSRFMKIDENKDPCMPIDEMIEADEILNYIFPGGKPISFKSILDVDQFVSDWQISRQERAKSKQIIREIEI